MEKRDFITFTQKGERKEGVRGASISIEYHLSIDSAKHVAMMCGTDKGKDARLYFSVFLCYTSSNKLALIFSRSQYAFSLQNQKQNELLSAKPV